MTNCSIRFCSEYPDLLFEQQAYLWEDETLGDYQAEVAGVSFPEDDGSFSVEIKLTPVNKPLAKKWKEKENAEN